MSMSIPSFRSGFVALVGRPNVGKSTLLNAVLGRDVAITSKTSQTTRKRMRAVVETHDAQIIMVDTPGFHKPHDALGTELNRVASTEITDADVIAFLIDATQPVGRGDAWVAQHLATSEVPRVLVITKADIADEQCIKEQLAKAHQLTTFDETIVISAAEHFNIDGFVRQITRLLPEGPRWFPKGVDVDMSDEELASEFIRKSVLDRCQDEIPYAVAVKVDDFVWSSDSHLIIRAVIYVERNSQKAIIIGKGGAMIKGIGIAARKEIGRLFGCRASLNLMVHVMPKWRRDPRKIQQFGLDVSE